ncbi:MAG: hypothetical protein WHT65_02915 [Pseudothermotoga sp.]
MPVRQVNQMVALLFVFALVFVIDVVSSQFIGTSLHNLLHPLSVIPLKSRVFAMHVIEGIKISLNQNSSERSHQPLQLPLGDLVVLGLRGEYIVAAGESKPGDVAVDPENRRLIGIVRNSDNHVTWIESIFSSQVIVQVTLESSTTKTDGELFSGNKIRVYENIDVTGFDVEVSDIFPCGTLLKSLGYAKIGRVIDREGIYYVVDNNFTVPSRLLIFPGY